MCYNYVTYLFVKKTDDNNNYVGLKSMKEKYMWCILTTHTCVINE